MPEDAARLICRFQQYWPAALFKHCHSLCVQNTVLLFVLYDVFPYNRTWVKPAGLHNMIAYNVTMQEATQIAVLWVPHGSAFDEF